MHASPPSQQENWPRLSALLDHALGLAHADLAPWLATLQQQEPALAAEVQALLNARPAIESAAFLQGQALPAEHTLAGQRLGHWLLESPLGGGGMGTVWLARRADERYTGQAAIKLLNLALIGGMGQASERRFRREGSILAALNHPHIAQLLDAGVSATGQPYLVLEYVQGCSITQYCDNKGLDLRARITLFLDVLAAVAHAHARLVVHRDIKPSNVWVTDAGVVKLLDFGIGKLLHDDTRSDATEQALTRAGDAALTPAFAAPEQLLGEPVSTGTDIYGLGLLLHLLLVGQHPQGDEALSVAQRLKRALEGTPPLPSVQVHQRGLADAPAAAGRRRTARHHAGKADAPTAR